MQKNDVRRVYVEKKKGFDVEAQSLYRDLKYNLGISGLEAVRIINRYDISGLTDEEYSKSRNTILSEPPVDLVYDETMEADPEDRIFAVEYLPGQYDQRADSASQCIQILTQGEYPAVKAAKVIVLKGSISDEEFSRIKNYCINPVESREASLEKPLTLEEKLHLPEDVEVLTGFIGLGKDQLADFVGKYGLAMSAEDLAFCQEYFRDKEGRDPSITEIRMIDTYWSDHCRHTTFLTVLDKVEIEDGSYKAVIEETFRDYLASRDKVYGEKKKDMCLMDVATIAMKQLRKEGRLNDLDESDEINACSIKVNVDVDGEIQEWVVMFKNETHNHPTEIEPFGGAATCLGGAIRDPLSGRSYVYQAMRVTGSGDPRKRVEDTLPGKLPQRKITTGAAAGYSSYGNQVGLATGLVDEIYDEGYVAKRMEIGAVVGAAPKANIYRESPKPGDLVILLGGRTGRDGCGGATGSSKAHTEESILTCGAEVQKGNPPTERKIQRLFRNPEVSRMIKKCNDFGAGGVSVAIGELAPGLLIQLDKVPKKYEGLDGTDLAISESQERMAVVVSKDNTDAFIKAAGEENLEATVVAEVTEEERLRMLWRGKTIVDISREFLDTNGVKQHAQVKVAAPPKKELSDFISDKVLESLGEIAVSKVSIVNKASIVNKESQVSKLNKVSSGKAAERVGCSGKAFAEAGSSCEEAMMEGSACEAVNTAEALEKAWLENMKDLNVCSRKGLVERFDSTIGAGTVMMPFGGKHQLTPHESMMAKIPVLEGDTTTGTVMSFGYNPKLARWSPFHGAVYAIVEAVAKIVAAGGDYKKVRLTLQEYFEKLGRDTVKWGKPFASLLGAYHAQMKLGTPAIGGKDSMSGSFNDLSVPPTLVAFAIDAVNVGRTVSPELKKAGSICVLIPLAKDESLLPDFGRLDKIYQAVYGLMQEGRVSAAHTVRYGGIAEAISKMCFGNKIGFKFDEKFVEDTDIKGLFTPDYGSIILELDGEGMSNSLGLYENGRMSNGNGLSNSDGLSDGNGMNDNDEPCRSGGLCAGNTGRPDGKTDTRLEEMTEGLLEGVDCRILGHTMPEAEICIGGVRISLDKIIECWQEPLEGIFPTKAGEIKDTPKTYSYAERASKGNVVSVKIARPRIFMPVFPGTNCEYDTARQFEKAGGKVEMLVLRNLTPQDIEESIRKMTSLIRQSQIIMLPGGFSGGDEPDGSGKFIATAFRNPYVKEAVMDLLKNRDGLMLGICNGFQALIKLGLVPYGEIRDMDENSPTLTFNTIGRHVSCMVNTRVSSVLSPWFNNVKVGDIHTIAVSHGEGRFVASSEDIERMAKNGQIATQYVDLEGNPTYDIRYNPNGSVEAIEGITSPDGRVLGKMGHSERIGANVVRNVPGEKDQKLFEAGVGYFG